MAQITNGTITFSDEELAVIGRNVNITNVQMMMAESHLPQKMTRQEVAEHFRMSKEHFGRTLEKHPQFMSECPRVPYMGGQSVLYYRDDILDFGKEKTSKIVNMKRRTSS